MNIQLFLESGIDDFIVVTKTKNNKYIETEQDKQENELILYIECLIYRNHFVSRNLDRINKVIKPSKAITYLTL
jgi:hypothetical protein